MMDKNFKVRVKFDYYFDNRSWYKVQYAHYRFMPIWRSIYKFDNCENDGFHSNRLFTCYDSAVSFAKGIKNINDVKRLHDIEQERYWKHVENINSIHERTKPKRKITNI